MNIGKLAPLALGGLILASGFATASVAQQSTPPGAMAGKGGPDARHAGKHHADPAERAAKRAEHLRAALQLRPDQEPALRAFIEARQPVPGAREKIRGARQDMAQMTTPQRLDAQKAWMDQRQARFEQRAAATKRFYAQLTPAQQKAFDALSPRGGGKGMRGHRGHQRG